MRNPLRQLGILTMLTTLAVLDPVGVAADSAAELTSNAQAALNSLYAKNAGAKALGNDAVAILVFPEVTKAGLGIGGQSGEGVLFRGGKPAGYYRTSGASF